MENKPKNPKPKIIQAGPLNGDQYYPQEFVKNNIFLHHTAGYSAKDAIDWWNQTPDHVGTPFIIDRDGTIFQCFDEKKWIYSLGVKGATNTEKHGIPIEIVSLGFLFKEGEKYYAYPNYPSKIGKSEVKESDVLTLDFKGYQYWQKYTDKQVESIISLVRWLVEEYSIPVQEDVTNFFEYNVKVATQNIPGIWSHTTVRKDKWDIFPQPNLIEAIYKTFPKGKVVAGTPKVEKIG